jgi:hypothetical protein
MANPFPFSSGQILTAAQMNGIAEAATNYTPTITAATGTFTTVTGLAQYIRINKLCWVRFNISITTNGTAGTGVVLTLPFTGVFPYGNTAIGVCRETAATGFLSQVFQQSTTSVVIINYDNSYPGGNGRNLSGSFLYEVA